MCEEVFGFVCFLDLDLEKCVCGVPLRIFGGCVNVLKLGVCVQSLLQGGMEY